MPPVCFALVLVAAPVASAQIVEATGSRALGMGGAFVAVANDSSATWWNPGGLATGPFLDMALAWTVTDSSREIPARRDRVAVFAISTLPGGFSYYRLRVTEIAAVDPTDPDDPGREDEQDSVAVRSLAATQLGVTFVQSVMPGVHAGATLKYVRGKVGIGTGGPGSPASGILDAGEELEGDDTDHEFDLDVGLLATAGAFRVGAVMRNVREPDFDAPGGATMRLPRQVRVGVAFDGAAIGAGPVVASFDADLRAYPVASGERRVVAIGGEGWLFGRRVGLRAGGRFNTAGAKDDAVTAGVSLAVRAGLFVDGHLVRGEHADDRGWGLAVRVSI